MSARATHPDLVSTWAVCSRASHRLFPCHLLPAQLLACGGLLFGTALMLRGMVESCAEGRPPWVLYRPLLYPPIPPCPRSWGKKWSETVERIQALTAKAVTCYCCVNSNLQSRNGTPLCETLTPKEIRVDVKSSHSQQVVFSMFCFVNSFAHSKSRWELSFHCC